MAGKFELYKDAADKYRFRLKAGNGEIIAVGESDESKPSRSTALTRSGATPPTPASTTRPTESRSATASSLEGERTWLKA